MVEDRIWRFTTKLYILQSELGKEAWSCGCDAGSHTRGCEFEPHAGHSYAFRFISAAFRAVSRALMVSNYSHWVMLGSGTGVGK